MAAAPLSTRVGTSLTRCGRSAAARVGTSLSRCGAAAASFSCLWPAQPERMSGGRVEALPNGSEALAAPIRRRLWARELDGPCLFVGDCTADPAPCESPWERPPKMGGVGRRWPAGLAFQLGLLLVRSCPPAAHCALPLFSYMKACLGFEGGFHHVVFHNLGHWFGDLWGLPFWWW